MQTFMISILRLRIEIVLLHNALKGRVVRLSRSHYIYNESRKLDYSPKLPIGFEIRSINKHYYNTYQTNIDSTYGLLWESDNEYIEKAFGFSILTHGEFRSICNTFFIREEFYYTGLSNAPKIKNGSFHNWYPVLLKDVISGLIPTGKL